jgi:hypothetical protein
MRVVYFAGNRQLKDRVLTTTQWVVGTFCCTMCGNGRQVGYPIWRNGPIHRSLSIDHPANVSKAHMS